jgi:hypothetical protein
MNQTTSLADESGATAIEYGLIAAGFRCHNCDGERHCHEAPQISSQLK